MRSNLTSLLHCLRRDFPVKLFLLLMFFYFVVRAYLLSITHDEALTVFSVVSNSYLHILLFKTPHPANNHLLNSLLVKFFISIFGYRELPIRLAGLLGGLLYLFAAYKLCQKLFSKTFLFYLCLLVLVLNPFVIDFFSLARGYSLALGFLMLSIFYFFNSCSAADPQKALIFRIKSFCLMSLAVISNFSFLNVYFALMGSYCIMEYIMLYSLKEKGVRVKLFNHYFLINLFYIFVITIGLSALIYLPLSEIAKYNLFYGGNTGFYHDTIGSLIKSSAYGKIYFGYITETYFGLFLLFVAMLFFINFAFIFYKKRCLSSFDKDLIVIGSIIVITVLSIVFQNTLLNTPFVLARAAIYFIPLFTLLVFVLWKAISKNGFRMIIVPNIILVFCVIVGLLHYLSCINLSHTYDWRYDASTKTVMNYIFEMEQKISPRIDKLTIGATWWLVPAINYYLLKHGGHFKIVEPMGPETFGPDGQFDFYYLYEYDKTLLKKYNLSLLGHYTLSDTYLGVSNALMSK